MTAHDHRTYVDGCYRCELSRDEVEPMSSDRTPADVIAAVTACIPYGTPDRAELFIEHLAAAGYRVTPIPDDNTRAEVLNLLSRAKDRRTAHSVKKRYAIADDFDHVDLSRLERMADLLAAAYLDGQPQDPEEGR